MKKFKFELKQDVTVIASGEKGKVISRLESMYHSDQYLVEHVENGSGKGIESWKYAGQLRAAVAVKKVAPKKKRAVVKKPTLPTPTKKGK